MVVVRRRAFVFRLNRKQRRAQGHGVRMVNAIQLVERQPVLGIDVQQFWRDRRQP